MIKNSHKFKLYTISLIIYIINIINYLIPIKSESIYVKGNKGLINEIKLLMSDFEYQKKVKFRSINSDYNLHKVPDKFLVSNKVEFYNLIIFSYFLVREHQYKNTIK